jgi:hypothetical protein
MNVSMPHPIEELDDKVQLMRVSWKKAFNYHNNLARTLLEARALIESGRFGPEWTLSRWMSLRCGLNLDQLVKMILVYSKLMNSEDREALEDHKERAARERREKAEERRKDAIARRAAAKERRESEARAREQEKLEREAARAEAKRHEADMKAEAKAEAKRQKAEAKAAKTAQAKADRAEKAKQKRAATKQAKQATTSGLAPADRSALLDDMAAEFRAGHAEAERGREAWISGTLRMAAALASAREQFPNNQAFGRWVKESDLPCSPHERRALIHMGRHLEQTRFVLSSTKRRNYETILNFDLKPLLKKELCESSHNDFSEEKTEAKSETAQAKEILRDLSTL